jgi:hypothetical protein
MTTHPTTAELLRFVEGDLPAGRAGRISKMAGTNASLAEEIEKIRADLAMASGLRDAAGDAETLSAERRIEAALTDSVTRTWGMTEGGG